MDVEPVNGRGVGSLVAGDPDAVQGVQHHCGDGLIEVVLLEKVDEGGLRGAAQPVVIVEPVDQ